MRCSHRTVQDSGHWKAISLVRDKPSFDKQFVRDWIKGKFLIMIYILPDEVVTKTVDKYKEAYELLTGTPFSK